MAAPDTIITLGSFQFQGFEVPESINVGGEQKVHVHELVGGARVVDILGRQDDDISWSGTIYGSFTIDALSRVIELDTMRVNGTPVNLSWFHYNYLVIVKHFKAEPQKFYQIPYTITLQVVQDLTLGLPSQTIVGIDDAVQADLNTAQDLSNSISENAGPDATSLDQAASINTGVQTVANAIDTLQVAGQAVTTLQNLPKASAQTIIPLIANVGLTIT